MNIDADYIVAAPETMRTDWSLRADGRIVSSNSVILAWCGEGAEVSARSGGLGGDPATTTTKRLHLHRVEQAISDDDTTWFTN